MITKFAKIKNIGRFVAYGASGDVELKRYNLLFGENGRGKTTLCAILRSLEFGDPAYIVGRKTLGVIEPQEITILLSSGGNAIFQNGSWNRMVPEVSIFDATFVSENVHSGDVVDVEHRRNLYSVIVGEEGVKLAKQIDELDNLIRAKNTEIREKGLALQAMVPGMTPEAIVGLPDDRHIEDAIIAKEREVSAAREAAEIRRRGGLTRVSAPLSSLSEVRELVRTTVEGIRATAEQRVREHIGAHDMQRRGQEWILEGLRYVKNDACPFCDQSLAAASDLLSAYDAFFGQAYNEFRQRIGDMRRRLSDAFSETELAKIDRSQDQNVAAIEFWSRFTTLSTPPRQGESDTERLISVRRVALDLLDRKLAAPLETVTPDEAFAHAVEVFDGVQSDIEVYNRAVDEANRTIAVKKEAVGAANVSILEQELTRLKAAQKRHTNQVKAACDEYETKITEKKAFEEKKAQLRVDLDDHTAKVINTYEQTINRLLRDFQAGFGISGTTHDYRGGVPSSNYKILINDVPVDLGDSKTPIGEPSFRNTLSAGDKSTLALAFFLAKLASDPNKATKIVIFDDPFNSQDGFRKDITIHKIKRCGEESAQVIVLSHDQGFLKRVWDRVPSADRQSLELARIGQQNTTITAWDIERATQDQYKADRRALREYFISATGHPRDVVQKIRPVLETYCRNLGAGAVAATDALGTMIGKVRSAGPAHQLYPLCDELDQVNEYTRRYHHGENPHAATEPISDTELQGYVRRALDMTGGT